MSHHRPNRASAARAEPLEARTLLAAAAVPAVPADVADRIDPRFYQAAVDLHNHASNALLRNRTVRSDSADRVDAYVHTAGDPSAYLAALRKLGAQVSGVSPAGRVVQAWIPADRVADVARLPGVTGVGRVDYPRTSVITSAGDSLLQADKVRNQFAAYGIDGTGVKVGVISDGVKDRASVGAELPANITVHPNHTGTGNEGTAMLEIVHDLAPGAQLYFSAPASSVDMVSSINYLVAQGCNVIVDDLGFFGEPYFADGPVALAAQNAVNQGVVYVSAAGNYSNDAHYQAEYASSGTAFNNGTLHEFSPGVTTLNFDINPGAAFTSYLQWSDPWGASGNNYDFFLYNGDTHALLDSSVDRQNGNDIPFEAVSYTNTTGVTVHAQITINKKTAAAVRELELFTFSNSGLSVSMPGDAVFGQQAVAGVISVAAAPAFNPNSIEPYSSHGDSTIYTNFATQTKVVRQTVDGTAIDGVQTQIGLSGIWPHNPFYGTSAAAPHAAAIAALIKQAKPSLTPAQLAKIMADTAVDLLDPGYDTASGAGRYDALAALYSVFQPAAPDLAPASDLGDSDTDNLTAATAPTFTGAVPAGSYVRLFVDGVESNSVQLDPAATTYAIQPATPLSAGPHDVTIRLSSGAAVPLSINSPASAALTITIDTTAPAVTNPAYTFEAPGQRLSLTFSKPVANSLAAADFQILDLTTNTTVPAADLAVALGPGNTAVVTFPNYTSGALPDGNYHVTFALGGVTDAAGNPVAFADGFDFFVLAGDANFDRVVDFADLVLVAQNYEAPGDQLWSTGDFTADGHVNFDDLVLIAQRYDITLPAPVASAAAMAAAPPPATAFAAPTPVKALFSATPIAPKRVVLTRKPPHRLR